MIMNNRILCVSMVVYMLVMQQVFAAGKITEIIVNDSSIELAFETTVGEIYQVQYCDNLLSGIWTNAESLFQASSDSSVRIVANNRSSCLFRVIKMETFPVEESLPPPAPPPPPSI